MTHEHPPPAGDGLEGWEEPTAETLERARPAPSGLPRVDAVVAALADLDTDDLSEHVAVIDRAHVELRAALDDPDPGDPGDAGDAGDMGASVDRDGPAAAGGG